MLNNFGISIVCEDGSSSERIVKDGSSYYALKNDEEYKIRLHNDRCTKCDADVTVDGEHIGKWRIDPYTRITIERPSNIERKFVLVRECTDRAKKAGVVSGRNKNGLISVTFTPEKEIAQTTRSGIRSCASTNRGFLQSSSDSYDDLSDDDGEPDLERYVPSMMKSVDETKPRGTSSLKSGATILGRHSDQKFNSVKSITYIDHINITTITIRLVVKDDYPEIAIGGPYGYRKTKVPPRIDDNNLFDFVGDR